MGIPVVFLVIAVVLFAISAFSGGWWRAPQGAYYPSLIAAGLFFWSLAQLWPMISK